MRRFGRDLVASAGGAFVYSFALGIATLVLPLLALAHGYSRADVGYLTASSAIAQMGIRTTLGAFMRRYGDWVLVLAAGALLFASCAVVSFSAAVVPFVLSELLQGAARGCFWTGSQTHVVRGGDSGLRRLAVVNVVSSAGQLGGPLAGGVIAGVSLRGAMVVAAVIAAIGLIPPILLDRLPPFPPTPHDVGVLWIRRGVDIGSLAGVTAGGWRGLLSSYVPVVLDHAGYSTSLLGGLISASNAMSIAGAAAVAWIPARFVVVSMASWIAATSAGAIAIGPAAGWVGPAAAALCVGGFGAGALQTLGPTVASDAVGPERRGDAIAAAGTARALALFVSPLAVGAALAVMSLTTAMMATGALMLAPAALSGHSRPRRPDGALVPVAEPEPRAAPNPG
ncbi:MAG TPA: MFS transporter [Micromonosporaceae bacterium]|jgi:MFS family permease